MKQLSLLQPMATRRSNSGIDGGSGGKSSSPVAVFWLVLHGLCCLISLVLGFRFSRLIFFLLFSSPTTNTTTTMPLSLSSKASSTINTITAPFRSTSISTNRSSSRRVVVGRHGILIRPWPHPNPEEVIQAHKILSSVQKEQRVQYGVKNPRSLIVVTPTYVRTFQALHLTGVMHSLMNLPYDVVWIVVEAGGKSNETAELIAKSKLRTVHIGFETKMPVNWADRHRVEDLMRVAALRLVREQKLDGIVVFADDSNMHSLEFFDEMQKVNWIGALSVGILVHSGDPDSPLLVEKGENEESLLPVQGPLCNLSDSLVGWHAFDATPYAARSAVYIGDLGTVLPRKTEWAGFVLNSRLLWGEDADPPEWVNDFDSMADESMESPLSLLKDQSVVEPLGSCGRKVLLWWLRVEARADSKFPPGWVVNSLEITVPAKHTSWPEVPPGLPSNEKVTTAEQRFVEEQTVKRPSKGRPKHKSSRGKKKQDSRVAETQFTSRHVGEK